MVRDDGEFEDQSFSEAEEEPNWDEVAESLQAGQVGQARMNGTSGRSVAAFRPMSSFNRSANFPAPTTERLAGGRLAAISVKQRKTPNSAERKTQPGIKRQTARQIKQDMPPTPRGCEWRRSEEGWNLWRSWSEMDENKTARIKKSRYAGYLSNDAWEIMKEYDHEAFLSVVGERLRRHSKR